MKPAKSGECQFSQHLPERRRGQSALSPLFAPATPPLPDAFESVDVSHPLHTVTTKPAKSGDCQLCPKAPEMVNSRHTNCAAVDRAGCPHFSPRPLTPPSARRFRECRRVSSPAHRNDETREKWGLPTLSQGARNGEQQTYQLRRRGQSALSPLFAPATHSAPYQTLSRVSTCLIPCTP